MARFIDADVLIATIKDEGLLGCGFSDEERESDVIGMVEETPAVDAAPVVHGEWVGTDYKPEWRRKCSVCSHVRQFYDLTPYCPNCGAKMKEET